MHFKSLLLIPLIFCSLLHGSVPKEALPVVDNNKLLIEHTAFTLQFNTETKLADWVCYELKPAHLGKYRKRSERFHKDPNIDPETSPSFHDYSRTGFDRGHLVPSADMMRSKKLMQDTFYLSNITPQHPSLNRYVWRELEELIRDWSESGKPLYICTGPYYTSSPRKHLGKTNIALPDGYFKVIADYSQTPPEVIGFQFDNSPHPGRVNNAIRTVKEIEELTGFSFFQTLSQKHGNNFKLDYSLSHWFPSRGVAVLILSIILAIVIVAKINRHRHIFTGKK